MIFSQIAERVPVNASTDNCLYFPFQYGPFLVADRFVEFNPEPKFLIVGRECNHFGDI
jgi:hypothetical protein